MAISFETIKLHRPRAHVLRVALHRPNVKNAFNDKMIDELIRVFSHEALDPEIRVLELTSEEGAFCAGGDLSWMRKSIELTEAENLEETRKLTSLFRFMNECPKPMVGVVRGAAIGGGVGLVSVCDYVLAETGTVFSLSEVRLGIIPACIGPFVVNKIGVSSARALFISAERFMADRALSVGLIHEVCPGDAALRSRADALIENMLRAGPVAMMEAKQLVLTLGWPETRASLADPYETVASQLARLRVSPEGQEGLRAFLEKRPPSWQSNNTGN